ncbi:hypothetical protein, partial [Burkholderia vietnamiensis]|uniref:hypothetical protein n=1 Tax=Burkholderia vietnamiensis TaxID=60552 RepID=UPI001CF45B36
ATLLAHQAHCALADFRGKLGCLLVHGSILSRVGASTKSGAVQDRSAARDPMRSFGDAICAELSSGYPVYPVLVALDYALHSITHDAIAFLRIGRI